MKVEMKVGPIQCSLSPVRVRMNRLPRFSRVHMSSVEPNGGDAILETNLCKD